jgi:hypothetical protein
MNIDRSGRNTNGNIMKTSMPILSVEQRQIRERGALMARQCSW